MPAAPPDMAPARWYHTSTTLGDGRVLVTAGTWGERFGLDDCLQHHVTVPELYHPAANLWPLLQPLELPIASGFLHKLGYHGSWICTADRFPYRHMASMGGHRITAFNPNVCE